MDGNDIVFFPVPEIYRTETGAADTGGALEHGLEHRIQFALRGRDDLKNFRCRGLLLQRLR